ncbi:MAG: histidine kinase dimerization/phosphoacceptor domain -containing protein [Spirochaetia bacterium]
MIDIVLLVTISIIIFADLTMHFNLKKLNNEQISLSMVKNKCVQTELELQRYKELFQEYVHRSKNSFAMLISYLGFQKDKLEDENCRGMVDSMSERIYTISMLQDRIFETKEKNLPIETDFIIENVYNRFASEDDQTKRNKINIHAVKCEIESKKAFYLGLIVFELLICIKQQIDEKRIQQASLHFSRDGEMLLTKVCIEAVLPEYEMPEAEIVTLLVRNSAGSIVYEKDSIQILLPVNTM